MPTLTNEMKREIILDHYSNPENKKTPEDINNYIKIRMDSDSCIDDITIYLKIENSIILDAVFDGIGCAISTASTDIICNLIKGKDIFYALNIIKEYNNMLHEKEYNEEILDELNAFSETYKQAARIKCAFLGAEGVNELIKGDKNER